MLEPKHRAHRLLKHALAYHLAHVERDVAVVFDRAFAFRFRDERAVRQPLASSTLCHHACGSANRLAGLSLVTALHLKAAWLNVHTSSEAGARGTTPLKILFALPEVPNCRTFTLSL